MGLFDGFNQALPAVVLRAAAPLVSAVLPIFFCCLKNTRDKPQHAPHAHHPIVYGAAAQLLPDKDTSPPLMNEGIKCIQGIIGLLLYYA